MSSKQSSSTGKGKKSLLAQKFFCRIFSLVTGGESKPSKEEQNGEMAGVKPKEDSTSGKPLTAGGGGRGQTPIQPDGMSAGAGLLPVRTVNNCILSSLLGWKV